MKEKFIKDFQFNDKLVNEQFAIKAIRKGKTADGRDFFDLTAIDKTGEIAGKIWEDALVYCEIPTVGEIVSITASVGEFRDKQQLKVSAMKKIAEFSPEDFLPSTSKNIDELWKYLKIKISEISDKDIKNLVNYFFADSEFIKKFKIAPGAEMLHHAYIGGLMEHTVEMLKLSDVVIESFSNIDRSLLIAGILFHDIGKMEELHMNHVIYRTIQGSLWGHISIGAIMVDKAIDEIKKFPEDLRLKIIHLILSHHGRLEYGSPVKPMTAEAIALNHLDDLSTKVRIVDDLISANEGNTDSDFSDKNFALDTKIYLK
jgi:3'-5' exoribonuclease